MTPAAPSELRLAPFPVSVTLPEGWTRMEGEGDLVLLASEALGAFCFLHVGVYTRFEPLLAKASSLLDQFVANAYPVGEPDHGNVGDAQAMAVLFHGVAHNGEQIAVRLCFLLSDTGLGAAVGGVAPFDHGDAVLRDVGALAESLRFAPIAEDAAARTPFVGRWRHAEGPAFEFLADGSFRFESADEGMVEGRFLVLDGHFLLVAEAGSSAQPFELGDGSLTLGGEVYARAA